MKDLFNKLLFGRDSKFSGLIALAIVMAVALGCTCGDMDLANIGKNENSNSSRTSSNDSPFSDDNDNSSDSDTAGTDSDLPDERLLNALVKSTTASFANAISTEDFSNLYSEASSDFRNQYSEQEMKDAFKVFIQNKRAVLPILAKSISLDPEYSPAPSIRKENGLSILVTDGQYDTKPIPLQFEYEYVKRGGEWKLLKLVVKLQ
jgi:hypothetical protein